MKVWIEWGKAKSDAFSDVAPTQPNVFSSVENLLEYWRRTRFPADTVDNAYGRWTSHLSDDLTCGWGESQRWGKEVDLDDYFVKKAQKDLEKDEENVSKKRKT